VFRLKINHVKDARATCIQFLGSILVVAEQEGGWVKGGLVKLSEERAEERQDIVKKGLRVEKTEQRKGSG
jgi:hypothetical protein